MDGNDKLPLAPLQFKPRDTNHSVQKKWNGYLHWKRCAHLATNTCKALPLFQEIAEAMAPLQMDARSHGRRMD